MHGVGELRCMGLSDGGVGGGGRWGRDVRGRDVRVRGVCRSTCWKVTKPPLPPPPPDKQAFWKATKSLTKHNKAVLSKLALHQAVGLLGRVRACMRPYPYPPGGVGQEWTLKYTCTRVHTRAHLHTRAHAHTHAHTSTHHHPYTGIFFDKTLSVLLSSGPPTNVKCEAS